MVMKMHDKERMINGELYIANTKELYEDYLMNREFLDRFNNTSYLDFSTRRRLVEKHFKHVGKNVCINKPFHCDYGYNISVGDNFYANYDCIFLDVCPITIGDNVFVAPRVNIFTATHPIDKDVRNDALEYGRPVTIGNDVWICGGVTINPGVTIGDNVVIGSGSVVTKDIPSNVIAAGNPCKVIRNITSDDKVYWENEKKKYYQDLNK